MRLEILEVVEAPEWVVAGKARELLAARQQTGGKHLVVVYRELETDGFIITAFLTRRLAPLRRREQIWP